jgi:hypothetical protein
MSANDHSRPIGRTKALPLVRMTLAYRAEDACLRAFLDRYRTEGVFVATDRVRPVGERIRFKIQLLDCSADYSSDAVVAAHEWKESKFGMRIRLVLPERVALACEPAPAETTSEEALRDPEDTPLLAVSLADYLCEPGATPKTTGGARGDDRTTGALNLSPARIAGPIEPKGRAHWPPAVRELYGRPSIEAIEGLHRTYVRTREVEPMTAMAAAQAMIDLARSDHGRHLVRSIRLLTRDGHEILELALERLEEAETPEAGREAQQLFDEALQTIVVP